MVMALDPSLKSVNERIETRSCSQVAIKRGKKWFGVLCALHPPFFGMMSTAHSAKDAYRCDGCMHCVGIGKMRCSPDFWSGHRPLIFCEANAVIKRRLDFQGVIELHLMVRPYLNLPRCVIERSRV